jgi:quercetin dioxygenase-like cupin family protein
MPKIWTVSLLVALALPGQSSTHHNPAAASQAGAGALHAGYGDLQWQVMVPELGADSPQVSILRVDPKTHATQLLIRMPKQMHVPMHWHSANETHTVIKGTMVFEHEGQRHELGPAASITFPPACTTRHGPPTMRWCSSRWIQGGTSTG